MDNRSDDPAIYLALVLGGLLPVVAALVRGGAIGAGITLCMVMIAVGTIGLGIGELACETPAASGRQDGRSRPEVPNALACGSVTEPRPSSKSRAYAIAVVGVSLATLGGIAAGDHITVADQAMLFLPAILLAALGGRGPSLVAAALSVGAFDFFFVTPRFSFAVSDTRSVITFVVMFVVGTAIGSLVARLRAAEAASRDRERRTAALLAFTRDSAAAVEVSGVTTAVIAHIRDVLAVDARVEIPDEVPLHGPVAIRVYPAGRGKPAPLHLGPAGRGKPAPLHLGPAGRGKPAPLHLGPAGRGKPAPDEVALPPDQHGFLEAVAHQAGVAIGRLQLATTARDADLRVKAEELRNALLSSVSHDLRTPLAAITGMATSLRDAAGDRSAGEREALDTIVEEAQRLSRILTNLLSITKVESGAEPRREWVPLEEIVGSALVRLEHELADHPVTVSVPPTALAHVDPILVEQLLLNLLDNASKHTPAGTAIEVAVSREPDRAVIEIADRGPGLPLGPFAQVFEKFYRGSTGASGAGLGLAVCRGIALAHQGGIEARPRDGGGTRFVSWFPDREPVPDMSSDDDDPVAIASAS